MSDSIDKEEQLEGDFSYEEVADSQSMISEEEVVDRLRQYSEHLQLRLEGNVKIPVPKFDAKKFSEKFLQKREIEQQNKQKIIQALYKIAEQEHALAIEALERLSREDFDSIPVPNFDCKKFVDLLAEEYEAEAERAGVRSINMLDEKTHEEILKRVKRKME